MSIRRQLAIYKLLFTKMVDTTGLEPVTPQLAFVHNSTQGRYVGRQEEIHEDVVSFVVSETMAEVSTLLGRQQSLELPGSGGHRPRIELGPRHGVSARVIWRVVQRHNVAPWAEGASLSVHPLDTGHFRHRIRRN